MDSRAVVEWVVGTPMEGEIIFFLFKFLFYDFFHRKVFDETEVSLHYISTLMSVQGSFVI